MTTVSRDVLALLHSWAINEPLWLLGGCLPASLSQNYANNNLWQIYVLHPHAEVWLHRPGHLQIWVGFLIVTQLSVSFPGDSLLHGGKHVEAPGPLSIPLSAFISITVFIWVWNYLVCVSVYWLINCRSKLCGRYTIGYCNPSIYNGAGCIVDIQ